MVYKNLKELNKSEEWVIKKLEQRGISKIEEVYYAEIQYDGTLYVDLKSDHLKE
ncbi:YetF domain-containing protein [Bacillus sp. AL-1R]